MVSKRIDYWATTDPSIRSIIHVAGDSVEAIETWLEDLPAGFEYELLPTELAPTGIVAPFAGSTLPEGWLWCDGSAISRTTYARLFAAIGTTWGSGDGSTTFNVPDLRDRVLWGKAASGDRSTLGELGGSTTHDHGGATGAPSGTVNDLGVGIGSRPPNNHTHPISAATHIPKYGVVQYILKA